MNIMIIKHLLCVIFLGVVCAVSTSCTAQEEKLTIEIIAAGTVSDFWTTAFAGAETAAAQYGADIKLFGPELEKDDLLQEHILLQSIARKPDAIIFSAADKILTTEVFDAANSEITIIELNSGLDDSRLASYVGSNNRALGHTLAQEIASRFSGGTIAMINNAATVAAAKERETGFLESLSGNPEFSILASVYCDADIDKAEKLAETLMEDHPNLTAIVCLNASATIGAGRAIEKAEKNDIFLAGVDCAAEEAWFMECGVLDVTICQNPYAMGYFGVEAAIRHIRGESAEEVIYTDFSVVTKETMFLKRNQQLIFPIS